MIKKLTLLFLTFTFCAQIRTVRNELNRIRDEIDEIYVRTQKIDTLQRREYRETKELKADVTNKLEIIERKLTSIESRLEEIENLIRKRSLKREEKIQEIQSGDEEGLFLQALRDYTAGEYQIAIHQFEEFIKKFPQSDYIIDAKYYLADAYFQVGDEEKAKLIFEEIIRDYPKSVLTKYSLLKLGEMELRKGNYDAAKKYFNTLIKDFPESEEAKKAKEKLMEIR
ncbi:MAG: tol-pal system protein YbgF [Candidatus Hydrothermales bacterium]